MLLRNYCFIFILNLIAHFTLFASDDLDELQSTADQGIPRQKADNSVHKYRQEYEEFIEFLLDETAANGGSEIVLLQQWGELINYRIKLYKAYVEAYPELHWHSILWFLEIFLDLRIAIIQILTPQQPQSMPKGSIEWKNYRLIHRDSLRKAKRILESQIETMTQRLVAHLMENNTFIGPAIIDSVEKLLSQQFDTLFGVYAPWSKFEKLSKLCSDIKGYQSFEVLSRRLYAAIQRGRLLEVFLIFEYTKIENFLTNLNYNPLELARELGHQELIQFFAERAMMRGEMPGGLDVVESHHGETKQEPEEELPGSLEEVPEVQLEVVDSPPPTLILNTQLSYNDLDAGFGVNPQGTKWVRTALRSCACSLL